MTILMINPEAFIENLAVLISKGHDPIEWMKLVQIITENGEPLFYCQLLDYSSGEQFLHYSDDVFKTRADALSDFGRILDRAYAL